MDVRRSHSPARHAPRDGGSLGVGIAVGLIGVAICTTVAVGILTVRAAVVVSAEATRGFARVAATTTGSEDADTFAATPSATPAAMPAVTPAEGDAPAPAAAPEAADALALLAGHLAAAGASGFTLSDSWERCGRPDKGPSMIQGCARPDDPTVIIMKPVDTEVAASEAARGVVLHEWAHVVQFRLGYAAVVDAADRVYGPGVGLEESADCMAIQLGALGAPGGYTTDCAGARGELATAFLAGRLG